MNKFKLEDLSINPQLLKENGYNKYNDSLKDKLTYLESWQKTVYNEHGKAYFIDFSFHDNSCLYRHLDNVENINPYSWNADLQFHSFEDDMTVNINISSQSKDLIFLEKFCDRMFKKMQFRNYDYFTDGDENNHKAEIKKEEIIENAVALNNALSHQPEPQKKSRKKL